MKILGRLFAKRTSADIDLNALRKQLFDASAAGDRTKFEGLCAGMPTGYLRLFPNGAGSLDLFGGIKNLCNGMPIRLYRSRSSFRKGSENPNYSNS